MMHQTQQDTVPQHLQVEVAPAVIVKVVVRHDTIRHYIVVEAPAKESSVTMETPHLLQSQRIDGDSLRLYEGTQAGENGRCTIRYLIGVAHDSVQYINVEAECPKEVRTVTVEMPSMPPMPSPQPSDWRLGAKVGWSPQGNHAMYGGQLAWRKMYAAANFMPAHPGWMFEAGMFFPLKKKARIAIPTFGQN
jgi:hypothetical protein